MLSPWAGSHPALMTWQVISRAIPRSALVQSPYIFLTACLESYEILSSVPYPGVENKVPTPCCLPPKPGCQDPLLSPTQTLPPYSLRVIRFLSISRLRSLPAHLATKLSTHSCGKGGAKRGTLRSWANMRMCREQGYVLPRGILLPRGEGASSKSDLCQRSGGQIL